MRIIFVWAVLNWLKSGSSVGCGEMVFDIIKCVKFTETLRNESLKKCSAVVETASLWKSPQWMLTLWSSGCNTIWIVTPRWELLLPPSGWRLNVVVLLTVTPCNRSGGYRIFGLTCMLPVCLLMGNKYLRNPINQIPWRSNPRKHNYQQRECRFVVISVSTVCVCLYPVFLNAV